MRHVMLGAAVLLCVMSVLGLIREYPAAVFARDSSVLKLDILLQPNISLSGQASLPGIPTVPLSWRGQRDLMRGCNDVQIDPMFQFMPPDLQAIIHENCLNLSAQTLSRAPTFGLAHLVQANAHTALGDAGSRNRALTYAQRYAPLEGWQAIRRVQLGLDVLNTLDAAARQAVEADLTFMMMTHWGVQQIAPLFVAKPDSRAMIEAVAQDADPARQQQLITALRGATQQ